MTLQTDLLRVGKKIAKRSLLRLSYLQSVRDLSHLSPPQRALSWVAANELDGGGIRVHSWHSYAYPEVTGYLVPTLINYKQDDLARRLLDWLVCIQRSDGSYASPEGKPFIFDTGQVLRGLLAGNRLDAAERAADYLCSQMVNHGDGGFGNRYAGEIPETVHLYVLPALFQAADLLNKILYRKAAERCLHYYLQHPDVLRINALTHFLAYELEALIDLDQQEVALPVLKKLRRLQRDDGSVRGRGGVQWICTPGLAQLAICWYKTGFNQEGDRAMSWLQAHQRSSGGFLGSYGKGATYFPQVELSWAAKFFLDASKFQNSAGQDGKTREKSQPLDVSLNANGRTKHKSTGTRKPSRLSGSQWNDVLMSATNEDELVARILYNQISEWGRVISLATRPTEKVLEIGSGTGEISLQLAMAGRRVTVLDISKASLEFTNRCACKLGVEVRTVEADATAALPFEDNEFECTWSAGLLEHFTPEERQLMLREWSRVTSGEIINLVPNAACVAYRAGKDWQEKKGMWRYGLEVPLLSMREDFTAAGLNLDSEFSVGAKHALSFLPRFHPLRHSLKKWMDSMSEQELRDCNQGYLLVSIGVKSDCR